MKPNKCLWLFSIVAFGAASLSLRAADQPSATETKLREVLRNTALQLRTAESEKAALQANVDEKEQQNKELADKVQMLIKQRTADQDAAQKSIADLTTKVTADEKSIAELQDSLARWKKAYEDAALLARTKEADRAKLAAELIVLKRQIADQKTKNASMFKLGMEVIGRYEKFGLGDALTAREPFIGITRTKFENLVQDYSDKLGAQKIAP